MGQLILNVDDGRINDIKTEGDVALEFDSTLAFCMSCMDGLIRDYLDQNEDEAEYMYDAVDALFYKFMEKVFPDIQPREFDLSDAGLLYAQDMIIDEAARKGITYDEALKSYEDKAKEYVRAKARRMS